MILHNVCTIHRDDAVTFDVGSDEEWQHFFDKYASHRCPSCKAKGVAHCLHDALNRSTGRPARPGAAVSEQREKMKDMLWTRFVNENGGELPPIDELGNMRFSCYRQ